MSYCKPSDLGCQALKWRAHFRQARYLWILELSPSFEYRCLLVHLAAMNPLKTVVTPSSRYESSSDLNWDYSWNFAILISSSIYWYHLLMLSCSGASSIKSVAFAAFANRSLSSLQAPCAQATYFQVNQGFGRSCSPMKLFDQEATGSSQSGVAGRQSLDLLCFWCCSIRHYLVLPRLLLVFAFNHFVSFWICFFDLRILDFQSICQLNCEKLEILKVASFMSLNVDFHEISTMIHQ